MPNDGTSTTVEQFENQDFKENTPPFANYSHMGEFRYGTVSLSSKVDEKLHVVSSIIKIRKKKIAMLQLKNQHLQKKIAQLTEIIASIKVKDRNNIGSVLGRSI